MSIRSCLCFVLCACVLYPAAPASSAVPTYAHDPRLKTRLAVHTESKPIGEILNDLSKQSGVHLTAAQALADTPVSADLKERPAGEVLDLIAGLILGEWRKKGSGYDLSLSETGMRLEQQQREKQWSLDERLSVIRRGLQVSAESWTEAAGDPKKLLFLRDSIGLSGIPLAGKYPPPPDDEEIARSLTSEYRRAVFELVTPLPLRIWEEAEDPCGTEMPLSDLFDPSRKRLAEIISGDEPPLPGFPDHREYWPPLASRKTAADALISGNGTLILKLTPDQLGRWTSFSVTVSTFETKAEFYSFTLGRYTRIVFNHVELLTPWFVPNLGNYHKVLQRADESKTVHCDPWITHSMGSLLWPPKSDAEEKYEKLQRNAKPDEYMPGIGIEDGLLAEMKQRLGIEYLSTRCHDTDGWGMAKQNYTRGMIIDGVARAIDAVWERTTGVYLFREKDWSLKRANRIPKSFFTRWTAKLRADGTLSDSDIASASAELTPQQKHYWRSMSILSLPLSRYKQRITCGTHGSRK